MAGALVATGLRGTVVHLLALLPSVPRGALAPVGVEGDELAGGTIETRLRVAHIGVHDLAKGGAVTHGAVTFEFGPGLREDHLASAVVLASGARSSLARVQVLAVFAYILVGASEEKKTTQKLEPKRIFKMQIQKLYFGA